MITAYKILTRMSNGSLGSYNTCSARDPFSKWNLEYKEGEITVPQIPFSKLFVFKCPGRAEEELRRSSYVHELWEVEVDELTHAGPCIFPLEYTDAVKRLWSENGFGHYGDSFSICIPNTYFAGWVKPIKRISPEI